MRTLETGQLIRSAGFSTAASLRIQCHFLPSRQLIEVIDTARYIKSRSIGKSCCEEGHTLHNPIQA